VTDERHGTPPTLQGSDGPLDREIRRLLAVDPSPAFEARVRARVAAEPAAGAWWAGRLWMAFGAAAATAALVLVIAVSRPEPPANTGAEPAGVVAGTGNVTPPSSEAAAPRADDTAADRSPSANTEATAAPGPAFSGAPTERRVAADPPRATAAPPGPPRFTRVVFSESEQGALRQLLAQARNWPVVVPVTAEAQLPVAAGEPSAELDIPPVALEMPAGLEIPPIAIEPLNLALLDTGAVE